MRRQGRRVFANYKKRGEWVELLFMTVAAGLGFIVAKPWGETARYDVIVENEGRFLRIQVKSTETCKEGCYLCELRMFDNHLYVAGEVDYFAIYILPEDLWYIFPARTLAGMGGGGADATQQRTQVRAVPGELVAADAAPPPSGSEDCGASGGRPA